MVDAAFPESDRPLLLLLDGHAMVFRAWFSIPERLSTSTGQDTRGAYGFLTTFLKTVREHRPTHAAVCFDTGAPTFRDEMYEEYKAGRPETPAELDQQFPLVKRILEAFRIPIFETEGYEADDLIGTLASRATEAGANILIVTGDQDELQLVSPSTHVLMYTGFANTKVYDIEAFQERFGGLMPDTLPDLKALQGDSSDNIAGVKGVGGKSAMTLLARFGSLEQLYDRLDDVEALPSSDLRGAKRIRKLLEEHRDEALLGKKLTTIVTDAPVEFDLEQATFWRYDRDEVVRTLLDLEFRSVIQQVPDPASKNGDASTSSEDGQGALFEAEGHEPAEEQGDYKTVASAQELKGVVSRLANRKGFAFDTETAGMYPMTAPLVGISLSNHDGVGWYVPIGHAEGEQLPRDQALDILRPLFASSDIPKTAHNANFDITVLQEAGVEVNNVAFDTMIAAALCGHRSVGLKDLALDYFQVEMTPIKELIGTGRKQITMDQVPVKKAAPYAAADADFTWRLQGRLDDRLNREGVHKVFDEIEIPLLPVMVKMQRNGIMVDAEELNAFSKELGEELERIINDTQELLGGREINLNSTQQIASILFDEFGVPRTRRTKTGYSMDASTLEGLMTREDLRPEAFELIRNVLQYREVGKLKSTYVDALPRLIVERTGRVHTSFNQVGSATGRISSADPNVQNIPVRTEMGRKVRKAFKADGENGWTLLAADYSQIELRILAHLSQEPGLLAAFKNHEDIHSATARAMYNTEEVTSEQRRIAKVLNFGVIYGLGPHGVAQQTDLTRKQGSEFIEMYFTKYPGIRDYIERVKAEAREKGYVETLAGRKRRLPELRSGAQQAKAAAERMAVNMPIQGTSADIIKMAMINIDREMERQKLASRMSIQVHDELIFEVAPGEMDPLQELVTELMPASMELSVPLEVELKSGPTWGDLE
ncbi:MAG: DNA polymerase I [Chloroflexota bacterium]